MTFKCVRCKKKFWSIKIEEWDLPCSTNGLIYNTEHFVIGLCPDCQIKPKEYPLTEKGYKNLLSISDIHERNILNLGSDAEALKKRVEKLEREMNRAWEVIRNATCLE